MAYFSAYAPDGCVRGCLRFSPALVRPPACAKPGELPPVGLPVARGLGLIVMTCSARPKKPSNGPIANRLLRVKSQNAGVLKRIRPLCLLDDWFVIRMELRMGPADAILSMTSDGNASGARSVWASRRTLWDRISPVCFLAPRRTLSSGTIRARIEPVSVCETSTHKSAPHPLSKRKKAFSKGVYHDCSSSYKRLRALPGH